MHPDDLEAITEALAKGIHEAEKRMEGRVEYLHERLDQMRPDEVLVPASVWQKLELRVGRLEDESRDLHRNALKVFLELEDVGERCADEVQVLREELTG